MWSDAKLFRMFKRKLENNNRSVKWFLQNYLPDKIPFFFKFKLHGINFLKAESKTAIKNYLVDEIVSVDGSKTNELFSMLILLIEKTLKGGRPRHRILKEWVFKSENGRYISEQLKFFEDNTEEIKKFLNEKELQEARRAIERYKEENKKPVAKIEKVEEEEKTPASTQNKIIKNSIKIIDHLVDNLEQGNDITPQLESFKEGLEKLNIDESKKEQLRGRVSELEQRLENIGEEAKQLMEEKSILMKEIRDITDPGVLEKYKEEIKNLGDQIKKIRKKNAREVELEQELKKANKIIENTESEEFKQKQIEKAEKLKKELSKIKNKGEILLEFETYDEIRAEDAEPLIKEQKILQEELKGIKDTEIRKEYKREIENIKNKIWEIREKSDEKDPIQLEVEMKFLLKDIDNFLHRQKISSKDKKMLKYKLFKLIKRTEDRLDRV